MASEKKMVLNDSVPVSLLTVRMIMQGKVSVSPPVNHIQVRGVENSYWKKKKIMSNIQFMQIGETSGHLCLYVFESNIR